MEEPPIDEADSLGNALHDSVLVSVTSDPMARTATLTFQIEHLRQFAALPVGTTWNLVIDSASKLLACRWEAWPGPCGDLKNLTRDEESAVVAEYQAKARTISVSWSDFEKAVAAAPLSIMAATLSRRDDLFELEGGGHSRNGSLSYEFSLTGEEIRVERSDGSPTSLAELRMLGEVYWDGFSKKQED